MIDWQDIEVIVSEPCIEAIVSEPCSVDVEINDIGFIGKGEDGFSPEVTITEIENGHRVNITDINHPEGQNFDVLNGKTVIDCPYLSIERASRYLYNVTFKELVDDDGTDAEFVPAGCSSFVRNGKLYRNLDWNYDNTASFHITCQEFEGISFINGLTDTQLNDNLISQLPYRVTDGVNEYGIIVSTHVLYNDWEAFGNGSIPLTKLPYLVLSRVKSMTTFINDISDVLNNLYVPAAMAAMEYLIQVLVTDGSTTYVLRPVESSQLAYEAVDISDNPKLTNFRWVNSVVVSRADLQRRPTGVERWNMITSQTNLSDLRFTAAYETATRLSEFIGINRTTKDSTDADLIEIYNLAHAAYLSRERDGSTWQTMHSVIYAPNGMEHLWIQEDWYKDYIASTGGGGGGTWGEISGKPFERLGTTMRVQDGTLDVYISEVANPAGGNTLSIG